MPPKTRVAWWFFDQVLVVLLIQTALEQEFRAVASVLEHASDPPASDRSNALIYGRIDEQPCCVVRTGIGTRLAEQTLLKTLEHIERPRLLLSIGLAGALAPELHIGQKWLIGEVKKRAGREPLELCAPLNLLAPEYRQAVPSAMLITVDRPVLSAEAKVELHWMSRAALCDMETHAVARLAVAHGVPWLGARIVSDSARETLPAWFLALPGLVERRAWGGLAGQLATHPQDLPRLLRLAVRMKSLERQLAQFTVELIRNVLRS